MKITTALTFPVRRSLPVLGRIRCNICDGMYKAVSKFQRFCKSCKKHSELYRFAGWLKGGDRT